MSLCINPDCPRPDHSGNSQANSCQACGMSLILQGRYRVIRLLSHQTGFGMVYEAYERELPKILKVLRREHTQAPKVLEMFRHEAEVLSQLRHPGVPFVEQDGGYFTVTTPETAEPLHCIVMEKIDGLNLTQWMQQQGNHPIRERQALRWMEQLVKILQQVHQKNFSHRDIKPENVMIRTSGQLALVDFGAARAMTQTYLSQVSQGRVATAISSAGYTPPEQEQGQAVPQSDFYALGRTIIYLLTAKAPTDRQLYDPMQNRFEWRSSAPQVSPALAELLDRMIAPRVVDRPGSARDILNCLQQLSSSPQPVSTVGVALPKTMLPTKGAGKATELQMGITTPSWQTLPQLSLTSPVRRRWWPWIVAAGLGVAIVGGSAIALRQRLMPPPVAVQVAPSTKVQLQRTLPAHSGHINDLLLFVDGLRMVSASADKTIRLWDLTSGQLVQTWSNQTSFVNTLLLSPDETRLYSGNADGTLQGRTIADGTLLWQTPAAHNGPINTIGRTPDGQLLISGGADGKIHIWNARTGKSVRPLATQPGTINSLVVTSDGQYVISGGSDRTIRVWAIETGQLERTLDGHESFINTLVISPDGRFLVSASADGTIRQWQISTGKLLHILSGHTSFVNDIVFSRDGQTLSTGSADQTVRIWDVETGAAEQVLTGFGMLVDHVVMSAPRQIITASRTTPAIKIWLAEQ